jgi:putative ABC transport system substrate-binding protein
MKRRDFIALVGGVVIAWPLGGAAQGVRKVVRIGILGFGGPGEPWVKPFHDGLRELGYVDGRNAHIEFHSVDGRSDRAAEVAADYVRRELDIIVAVGTPSAHAAKNATSTIPIVMSVADPLATGLVASLGRPGGNITGVASNSPDLVGKRLELLREIRPDAIRVGFLGATNDPNTRTFVQATEAAATLVGMRLQPVLVAGPDEFDRAFAAMVKERAEGIIVQPLLVGYRANLAALAMRHRLPMVADQRLFAVDGSLVAYGADTDVLARRFAFYVDQILKGVKPTDLPVELPTKYHLVVNLKTAKALGLTMPQSVLLRTDEVIE